MHEPPIPSGSDFAPRRLPRIPQWVSIVVAIYNEQEVIGALRTRLTAVAEKIPYGIEFILVDDGSSDATPVQLAAWAADDVRVRVITLARNFGHQIALTAGLDAATGDAVVTLDADLQDPPELIPRLIEEYAKGYEVVLARRRTRAGETVMKRATAWMFYRAMRLLVDERLPADAGDFRLIGRTALEALRGMRETHRFLRGMVAWTGFPCGVVEYDRAPRAAGATHYSLRKMLRLAFNGAISFSTSPLRFSLAAGMITFLAGIVAAAYAFFVPHAEVSAASILICLVGGLILISLAILGEYVGRVFDEVKGRPLYVVAPRAIPVLAAAPVDVPAKIAAAKAVARQSDRRRDGHRAWVATLLLVIAVLSIRLVYMVHFSPYELVGDEAYYWEWSRHPAWCYDEKGPGLAWIIAGVTRVLGESEWAIRLPVALAAAVATLLVARLATACARGDERAGLCAAILFCLSPAYHANAQLCTQDGMMIAFWAALAVVGWKVVRRCAEGASDIRHWLAFGVLLGVAFLVKQTALLFVPSVVIYLWLMRRTLKWNRGMIAHALLAMAVFGLIISPLIIWNARHNWPTFQHTAGHLTGGGDQGDNDKVGFSLLRPLVLIGAQAGSIGPAMLVMMALACAASVRAIRSHRASPSRSMQLWMICCAVPALMLFLGLSFFKPVLASWPFPMFVTLTALTGALASRVLVRHHRQIKAWRAARTRSSQRVRRPGTLLVGAWDVTLIYGIGAALLISFPTILFNPFVSGWAPALARVGERQMIRISGHRDEAMEIQWASNQIRRETGRTPILIADYYQNAALAAYYMPSHPNVYNAERIMGGRASAYDLWPQTNLHESGLVGRPAVLIGKSSRPWGAALQLGNVERIYPDLAMAQEYRGPDVVWARHLNAVDPPTGAR